MELSIQNNQTKHFIVNLTPNLFLHKEKYRLNNAIGYNLYSWYDIFIKFGTSKFITLFCDEVIINPKTGNNYL